MWRLYQSVVINKVSIYWPLINPTVQKKQYSICRYQQGGGVLTHTASTLKLAHRDEILKHGSTHLGSAFVHVHIGSSSMSQTPSRRSWLLFAPSHTSSAFYILLSFLFLRMEGISSWWAMRTISITCHYYFIKVKEVTHQEELVLRKCWFVIVGPKHIKQIDISCKETSFNHQEYITFIMNLLSIWTGRKKWINTITPLECERKQDSSTLPVPSL